MSDTPILTLPEAAELLRVTQDWLQRSTCPRVRVGGIVRWDRDTCLAWMRAHVTKAAA
jgi:predicted DNA-binding transcriptional regulator AlpA